VPSSSPFGTSSTVSGGDAIGAAAFESAATAGPAISNAAARGSDNLTAFLNAAMALGLRVPDDARNNIPLRLQLSPSFSQPLVMMTG
jgi:hypothetical protein